LLLIADVFELQRRFQLYARVSTHHHSRVSNCHLKHSKFQANKLTRLYSMGYSTLASQALSAPPFLLAFVVVLVTASLSDRYQRRSSFLIFHSLVSAVAYLTIGLTGHFHSRMSPMVHTAVRYFCIYPAASGFFSAITIIITWSMDNRVEHEGKGTGVALLNIIGQCGPLIGTRLYPESDGPWYTRGMFICSFFMTFVVILAVTQRLILQRANERMRETDNTLSIEMEEAAGEGEGLIAVSHRRRVRAPRLVYII
jgi:MFS family permease